MNFGRLLTKPHTPIWLDVGHLQQTFLPLGIPQMINETRAIEKTL